MNRLQTLICILHDPHGETLARSRGLATAWSCAYLASNQALLICVGVIKSLVHTVCACAENSRGLDGCDEIIIINGRRDEGRGQAKNMAASS